MENFDARSPLQIDENKYADLVKFWIENRGNYDNRVGGANYGIYAQDHDRFFNQPKGQGHAVRANLFYNGLAAAGAEFKNYTYLSAAEKIWSNITEKQMYVTGGVGATAEGEAYADDYILPNDGYCETCAQVAMGFFSENMSLAFGESKYADTVEKYIYNGVLGCVGDNGTSYYYQQPLDNKNNSRWSWIDHTPCCPPMFLKFYSQLPSAIYAYDDSSVYVNQFISSAASLDNGVEISQTTDLPWGGNTTVTVTKANGNKKVYLRIPDWAKDDGIAIKKDGKDYVYAQENGYAVIDAADGTVISMSIEMNAHRVYSNENVEANRGKVALQYGPVIYCVEKPDNLAIPNFSLNGGNFSVPAESKISAEYDSKLLGGAVKLTAEGECCDDNGELSKITVTAIPFYLRSNRGQDTSYVWINEAVEKPQTISRHWLSQALGSTRSFGNSAAAAFDGNQSTYWSAGSSSVPQAIMVDLGKVTEIDKISAAFKSSFSWDYSLLISDDMDSWTEYSRSDGESIKTFTCVKKAKARYAALKINNAPENELAAVSELSVYSGKTNIAKGKPCSASSTLDTGESVFAMTDGNSDSRYCPSGEAKPQTLLFDLGEIADVTSMEILFEKPSAWTYDISVSADGENFTEYRRETYNMTEDRKVRTIVKNAKARYIKFSITKTTGGVWASVWEFNVKTKTELKDIFSDILGRSIKAAAPENMLISGSDGTLSADVQNAQSLQWQVDKNDLNGFVNIAGANSPRLTQRVTYENAGYKYRLCAVTNGKTVYSNTVSFSVYSKPQSVAVAQSAAGSMQLSARVYPPTARQTVAWSSSDNKTADVSASGLVRFKKDGKVTITARTPDGVAGQITIKNGWVKEGAKFYAYAANTKLLNRLVTSAGRIYCADKTGARVTGGVYTIGKKTYAFDKNGVKISGTKVKKIGKYKYLIKSGVVLKNKARRYGKNIYVAGKSGRALGGNRVVKAGGKLYFVDKSGRAATKRWVSFRKKSYYASANGSLYVNAAVKIGGKKYSFNKKGVCSNK